mmetsp:Transcript_8407/g.21684  ORF Transcript_8407/g.21684 Transcript_8407/m.21684 type:complete len:220 (+) Transcript_8407:198-857(+)
MPHACGRGHGAGRHHSGLRDGYAGGVQAAKVYPQAVRLCHHFALLGDFARASQRCRHHSRRGGSLDGMRRCARAVLRPDEHLRPEWVPVGVKPLPLQRRLRRPGVLQHRGHPHPHGLQVPLPESPPSRQGKPREQQHEQDIRIRGRAPGEVLDPDVFRVPGSVLLASPGPRDQPQGLRGPRGPVFFRRSDPGRSTGLRPQQGAAGSGLDVRDALERPHE